MISKKIFLGDGTTSRFLPDFIVRSENYARPYVYIYDNTLDPGGTEDKLVDGTTDQANWSWPDNIWKRGSDLPKSGDIVTADKWEVVDNSIAFYSAPIADTTVWTEVATTSEEFGDTLVAADVIAAEASASAAAGSADAAAASAASVAASAAQIDTNTADIATNTADIATNTADKVSKAGDTMTGQLKGITPVAAEDLTRKDYVDGLISSGEYTPTLTPIVNFASYTTDYFQYIKSGNYVTVSGGILFSSTASGTTTFKITVPSGAIVTGTGWGTVSEQDGDQGIAYDNGGEILCKVFLAATSTNKYLSISYSYKIA